jgi:hypothetical protein
MVDLFYEIPVLIDILSYAQQALIYSLHGEGAYYGIGIGEISKTDQPTDDQTDFEKIIATFAHEIVISAKGSNNDLACDFNECNCREIICDGDQSCIEYQKKYVECIGAKNRRVFGFFVRDDSAGEQKYPQNCPETRPTHFKVDVGDGNGEK